jgi:hypothetical protein
VRILTGGYGIGGQKRRKLLQTFALSALTAKIDQENVLYTLVTFQPAAVWAIVI